MIVDNHWAERFVRLIPTAAELEAARKAELRRARWVRLGYVSLIVGYLLAWQVAIFGAVLLFEVAS